MVASITKTGERVDIVYNDAAQRYSHFSVNVNSGLFVGLLQRVPTILETNALGKKTDQFPFYAIGQVNSQSAQGTSDQEKALDIYNKLKELL